MALSIWVLLAHAFALSSASRPDKHLEIVTTPRASLIAKHHRRSRPAAELASQRRTPSAHEAEGANSEHRASAAGSSSSAPPDRHQRVSGGKQHAPASATSASVLLEVPQAAEVRGVAAAASDAQLHASEAAAASGYVSVPAAARHAPIAPAGLRQFGSRQDPEDGKEQTEGGDEAAAEAGGSTDAGSEASSSESGEGASASEGEGSVEGSTEASASSEEASAQGAPAADEASASEEAAATEEAPAAEGAAAADEAPAGEATGEAAAEEEPAVPTESPADTQAPSPEPSPAPSPEPSPAPSPEEATATEAPGAAPPKRPSSEEAGAASETSSEAASAIPPKTEAPKAEAGTGEAQEEADPCDCRPVWKYIPEKQRDPQTFYGCAETPDFPAHPWCFVVGNEQCLDGQASSDMDMVRYWVECELDPESGNLSTVDDIDLDARMVADAVGFPVAVTFVCSFLFPIYLSYLMNHSNPVVRVASFKVVTLSLAVFIAILFVTAQYKLLKGGLTWFFGIEGEEDLTGVATVVIAVAWYFSMTALASYCKGSREDLLCVSALLMHTGAFFAIEFCTPLQNTFLNSHATNMTKGIGTADDAMIDRVFVYYLIFGFVIAIFLKYYMVVVAESFRFGIKDESCGTEWIKVAEESETVFSAILVGAMMSRCSLYLSTGVLPAVHLDYLELSADAATDMAWYGCLSLGLWWAARNIGEVSALPVWMRTESAKAYLECHAGFTALWIWMDVFLALVYINVVAEVGPQYRQSVVIESVAVAYCMSPAVVISVMVVYYLHDRGQLTDTTQMVILEGCALLIGVTWQKAFSHCVFVVVDRTASATLESLAHTHEVTDLTSGVSLLVMIGFALPVWRFFLLPVAVQDLPPIVDEGDPGSRRGPTGAYDRSQPRSGPEVAAVGLAAQPAAAPTAAGASPAAPTAAGASPAAPTAPTAAAGASPADGA
eukprot:TRINITY_DN9646_c0_g1_i1.p1 TRINITY_DN9646_c0_g1~~TRINITY_DN9646_c0_g1_i1.p1  ORF type:complete len:950 (+),score=190.86 TRINITY_DN9646_c0_g1_i1:65-2914(+)